ncbi:MAG: HAMP domain-containing histidine kinase [Ilumatobacter sp.]|uniref:HAMP domain-containing sensor histidine kinase n=1 Tax=Ilumatobacter sp. TaxID=1967498 RepID=UPI001DF50A63|nr:HAMP domain-containing histidine kinase [Ilumatobacter sp.]MBT5277897.1 HAMP domain-containing histidine kinase [Ilumatobacter sp.]MBT5554374.1 HAMP domain-containing histidine kinase [Ilumatobacter sp.]MBT5865934.1 HAMP domain-containing histidine kinase [Ilumatobacter sp.]MDG0976636.1 HAMP domain-containing sensor histidine kinase [Ilumatobacter sp.]
MARQRSLRLRTRVTLFFALIALFAGSVLIGVTYGFARSNLLAREDSSARDQAIVNASQVREEYTAAPGQIGSFFDADLRTADGGFASLLAADTSTQIAGSDTRVRIDDYPASLVDTVRRGGNGRQYAVINGEDYVVVGLYIGAHDAAYFEAFPLSDTERTLRSILTALALGGLGGLILASLFGFSTSRRLLRPLSRVADAAEDIASGGLDTRLVEESDPDLDRLAGSFNDMADAVQTRIEREARFASDVSHELRSPITALTAAVEVMDGRREEVPERTRQALDVVVGQVRRFDSMVIDLLELSRLDAGATDMNVERLDIVDLTRRIAGRYGAPDVPISVAPRTRREVSIDKVRYERIVGNLIENAKNHGGGAVEIQIEPARDKRIRIAVIDDGPGVAQGERERIFERFARGSAARHRIGTGLGLALVAEHSSAMGGRAWVEDGKFGGARFVVELPMAVDA